MPYNQVRSFEEWVITWFDHPATTFDEYADFRREYITYRPSPYRELLYVMRAFETAETILAPFTNNQIGLVLWFIVRRSSTKGLLRSQIPHADRKRYVDSLLVLYEQLFARRCSNYLFHLEHEKLHSEDNPLNHVCYYFWWNLIPVFGTFAGRPYVDDWFLDVLLKILDMNSEPCQESALRGLANFPHTKTHPYHRYSEVQRVLDRFSAAYPHTSPELRAFALQARAGTIS